MNALAQPAAPIPQTAAVALLRTLVLCDLVDSTALVERLGDQGAAELFRKHDRLARALLSTHGGREIDKTDGFLLMFDRPVQAVAFALDYQRALKQLGASEAVTLAARVGVHVGDVVAWDNAADDIANGAKPIEIEGLVKPITSRLMQLALPKQILLSGVAYALAHRAQGELGSQLEKIRWRTHGRYRFKGIPDPIPVFEVGEEGFAPLKAPPWSGKAHREVPFWRRPATLGIELFMLFALLAIPAWYLLKAEPAIAFAQRDWVVVGDLKNLTGEAAFDDSIETAFRIGLEQSRYVNVLSDLKTRETIRLMQRDPDATDIDRAIGSEIAIRDGARALILPTIAEIGGRVRVTAEVIDPQTQTTVYSESADGVGEASVLPSLDKVNQKLRVRLGEALATVSKESQPLEKVATKNLDALRAYSLATAKHGAGDLPQALILLEEALRIDPEFTLALVARASVLFSADREEEAMESLRKAASLKDRLTPRDSLYVAAWQSSFGSPAVALEKWRTLATVFPDFFKGSSGYAFFAWQLGNRYQEAITAAEHAASDKNPNRVTTDYLLGVLYLGEERYQDAEQSFSRARSNDDAEGGEFRSMTFAAKRDFSSAMELLSRELASDDKPVDLYPRITQIAMLVDQGKWKSAIDAIEQAKERAQRLGVRKAADFRVLQLSLQSLHEPANSFGARIDEYLSLERGTSSSADAAFQRLFVAYLAARSGRTDAAKAILDRDEPRLVRDYPLVSQMSRIARAEYARATGRADQAISMLTPLLDGSELCLTHVVLMDAYAASGANDKALAQAEWLSSHRGRAYVEYGAERVFAPFNVAQTDLAVLRSAELQRESGNLERAKQAIDAFRRAWPESEMPDSVSARVRAVQKLENG